jgi:hypothetical protein
MDENQHAEHEDKRPTVIPQEFKGGRNQFLQHFHEGTLIWPRAKNPFLLL